MKDLQTRIAEYEASRLTGPKGYLSYYDASASRMKRRHLASRTTAAVGAVLIPVLNPYSVEVTVWALKFDPFKILVSVIGLAVAVLLALEGVFHYKEQWQNFRGTEQFLLSERFRFDNRIDRYSGLADEAAFQLFVSRVEKAILDENNVTLNILGRAEPGSTAVPANAATPTTPGAT